MTPLEHATVAAASVPVHPEQVAGDPRALAWNVPEEPLPVGRLVAAPGALGQLLSDGTLSDGLVGRGLVWLWLADGRSWRAEGGRVREALQTALLEPGAWDVVPAGAEVLTRVTEYVLTGSLSDYIASHGGAITVSKVTDDTLEVSFEGACAHCPAADDTLHSRIEAAVREHYPDLRAIVEKPQSHKGRLLLWPSLRAAG
jgi:Fe/S biogenesis protein NfuA